MMALLNHQVECSKIRTDYESLKQMALKLILSSGNQNGLPGLYEMTTIATILRCSF